MNTALLNRAREVAQTTHSELARHLVLVETQRRIIHRQLIPTCAWCGLVTDGIGNWAPARLWRQDELTTGSCCPACLTALLSQVGVPVSGQRESRVTS